MVHWRRGISVESRLLLTTVLRLLEAFVVGMQALVPYAERVLSPNPGTENSTCSNRGEY